MSPGRTSTPSEPRSCALAGFRAIATTSWPAATSCRVTRPPMKPVAPVTKYLAILAPEGDERVGLDERCFPWPSLRANQPCLRVASPALRFVRILHRVRGSHDARRCFYGGNAHPQTHPFSPRRRPDESRRRDRAQDGSSAPPT